MNRLQSMLRVTMWFFFAVATTSGFLLSFGMGHVETGLVVVPAVAMVFLLGLEWLIPDRPGAGSARDPQFRNDVFHSIAGQGAGNAAGQMVFVVSAALLAGEISERWGTILWPAQSSLWIQVPLAVVLTDGLDYWRHRWAHSSTWLWPVHMLHHDVEQLNVLKSGRGHFLDMFTRNLIVYAPLALVGAPREVMLVYAAAVTVLGPIAHANVSLRVPRFLHRWLMTPQVHHVHHARALELSCSNYANVFPVWDRLFGTFEHPENHGHFEYGIEEDSVATDILDQTLAPFVMWRTAWQERKTRARNAVTPVETPTAIEPSLERPRA